MTPEQSRRAEKLIQEQCCNFDHGNCLLLDDGEPCVCPQRITDSVCCRWFRHVVLKTDPQLEADIFGVQEKMRTCAECGCVFYPNSNRAKYCPVCKRKIKRIQNRECKRRRRSSVTR